MIGRGQSPSIEPDYDEDDAWWDSITEESRKSLSAIPAMTSNETNQRVELFGEASGSNAGTTDAPRSEASRSNVDATGAPQGDHHVTSSSSSGVELFSEASGSNAGTTDAPRGEASGSNAYATGAPQGDHRVTSSSSSGVELFSEASGSNAGTTDAPRAEASGSNAYATGSPQGDQHTTMSTSTPMLVENVPSVMQRKANLQEYWERSQLVDRTRVLEAEAEVVFLRSELKTTQRRAGQLQQLSEEDQALHPSNKRTLKCMHARTAKITGNICTVYIAACHHAMYS